MLGSRHNRRIIGWLAVLACLARLVLAVICHPLAAGPAGLAADMGLGEIVICTSHGASTPIGGGEEPAPGSSDPGHCQACALVQVMTLAGLLAIALVLLLRGKLISWSWCGQHLLPDHLRRGGVQSRAPPLPA